MTSPYLFQYCQKIVLFSVDRQSVLFALRQGEADYNGTWSLIGGKMETTDANNLAGLKREKDEEVGASLSANIAPMFSCFTASFTKKDGSYMILPHIVAVHVAGDVRLNPDEYADYTWVSLADLKDFGPRIENTTQVVANAQRLLAVLTEDDFVEI